MLSRYERNGVLDKGFGHNGSVSTRFRGSAGGACAVVLQPDGRIVAAGRAGSEDSGDLALVRYKKNGRLDRGFGTGGRVITDFFGNHDQLRAIALQPDGKIVATGYAYTPPDLLGSIGPIAVLVRYNPDGSLDEGFGTGGKVATNILFPLPVQSVSLESFDCDPHDLVLQPDGRIVVGGTTMLARFNADGTLDEGFGSGGKVATHPAHALALQPDGKLILAGNADISSLSDDFVLTRYNPDGSPDLGFGNAGKIRTDFGGSERAHDLVLLPGNKLVVVGTIWPATGGGDSHFALVRFLLE
jgi:uncharacterized delta-60 repeat protein